jgi:dienelactone hydrolase
VGITGISLGGFISFAAVPVENRLAAAVPILGSPDWDHRDGRAADPFLLNLMKHSPVRSPESFAPCAVLACNAGKDVQVPPHAAREFVRKLEPFYSDCPERLKYLEYPESEHMMREQDWVDLWQHVTGWFAQHLA